jgi:hypothetical protein
VLGTGTNLANPTDGRPAREQSSPPSYSTLERPLMKTCTQLDHDVNITELPESVEGCEDCLAIGSKWLHLRICLECDRIGCCDGSLNRHATAHAASADHPIIRSLQLGENWSWCFVDRLARLIPRCRTVLESRCRRWHGSRA